MQLPQSCHRKSNRTNKSKALSKRLMGIFPCSPQKSISTLGVTLGWNGADSYSLWHLLSVQATELRLFPWRLKWLHRELYQPSGGDRRVQMWNECKNNVLCHIKEMNSREWCEWCYLQVSPAVFSRGCRYLHCKRHSNIPLCSWSSSSPGKRCLRFPFPYNH